MLIHIMTSHHERNFPLTQVSLIKKWSFKLILDHDYS